MKSYPKLHELSFEDYKKAKVSGMFWVHYPEATGIYDVDANKVHCGENIHAAPNGYFETPGPRFVENIQETSVEPYEYYEGFGSVSSNKDENTKEKHGHYFKHWDGKLDIYRICDLFEVNDAAISHAVKKLLCTGNRGHKDFRKDIEDVIDTLERKLEMIDEESEQGF